jgi:hypothetical protein
MATVNEDLATLLAAVRALHSSDPAIRRPAIAILLHLAREQSSVQTDAECVLMEEFGPCAITEGIGGCSGPIEFVEVCDGNCRSCVWLWQEQPASCSRHSSIGRSEHSRDTTEDSPLPDAIAAVTVLDGNGNSQSCTTSYNDMLGTTTTDCY